MKNVATDWTKSGLLHELELKRGESVKLEELMLDFADITEIPTSIDSLRKLEKLSASCCESLRDILSLTWDLQSLQQLDISGFGIEKHSSAIGRLKNLHTMSLLSCCNLKEQFQVKLVTCLFLRFSVT